MARLQVIRAVSASADSVVVSVASNATISWWKYSTAKRYAAPSRDERIIVIRDSATGARCRIVGIKRATRFVNFRTTSERTMQSLLDQARSELSTAEDPWQHHSAHAAERVSTEFASRAGLGSRSRHVHGVPTSSMP